MSARIELVRCPDADLLYLYLDRSCIGLARTQSGAGKAFMDAIGQTIAVVTERREPAGKTDITTYPQGTPES